MKGLRLPLLRRPDPVLTEDELDLIHVLLLDHISSAEHEMAQHLVSESLITSKRRAEWALAKVEEALGL